MAYLNGFKPNRAPVPEVPKEITGPCVYGHIVTNDHRDHFRHLHPDIEEWQSASPDALISVASVLHPRGCHIAVTAEVYYQDQWHTCLVHMNNKLYYGTIIDQRRPGQFMAAVEKELGITTEPNWYPCYAPAGTASSRTGQEICHETMPFQTTRIIDGGVVQKCLATNLST